MCHINDIFTAFNSSWWNFYDKVTSRVSKWKLFCRSFIQSFEGRFFEKFRARRITFLQHRLPWNILSLDQIKKKKKITGRNKYLGIANKALFNQINILIVILLIWEWRTLIRSFPLWKTPLQHLFNVESINSVSDLVQFLRAAGRVLIKRQIRMLTMLRDYLCYSYSCASCMRHGLDKFARIPLKTTRRSNLWLRGNNLPPRNTRWMQNCFSRAPMH